MTEVSVVIPTKNEEASIGTCIEKIQRVFHACSVKQSIPPSTVPV